MNKKDISNEQSSRERSQAGELRAVPKLSRECGLSVRMGVYILELPNYRSFWNLCSSISTLASLLQEEKGIITKKARETATRVFKVTYTDVTD